MDPLTTTAASGMRARMESLDMLANNIANSSSTGFKADSEFYGMYHADETSEPGLPAPSESPVIEKQWTDFSQGQINSTSSDLDLALMGDGFFTAQTPSGPVYTRDGSFRLSKAGTLETRSGYPVLNSDGKPIHLEQSQPVAVDSEGWIQQAGAQVAQLKIVNFTSPQTLSKQEKSYFLAVKELTPVPAKDTKVQQRGLESSNVQPAQAAVRLVSVMRQFEMLQKAMSIGNDMNKRAVEDVARVGE